MAAIVEAFLDRETSFTGWRVRLGERRAVATPAVGQGRVFVGGGYGSHVFCAFDASSGAELWRVRTDDDGPTAAVFADGRVVFNTECCTIYAVEAASGRIAWKRWLGDPLRAQPAVDHGTVFMAYPAQDRQFRLAAFRLGDGEPLWEGPLGNEIISAPVVADGCVYLSTYDGLVSCVAATSGKELWSRPLRATSAPWVWHGNVYVAHREDGEDPSERVIRLRRGVVTGSSQPERADYLRSKRGSASGETARLLDTSVGFGDAPGAARLDTSESLVGEFTVYGTWRYQGSRPCVDHERLYATVGDRLTASDPGSHESLWTWSGEPGRDGERALTPPAAANGRVFAGTRDGRVCCWDSTTGALRWAVPVGSPVAWQPAVLRRWVYAGLEDGSLVGFDTRDPAVDGWPMWGGGPGHNGAEGRAA